MKYFALLSLLFAAALASCTHSTAPPATKTAVDTTADTNTVRFYPLTGEVSMIDIGDSRFDTVTWFPASLDSVQLMGIKTESVKTALSGSYFFDSLPAGTYTVSVSKPGYAEASIRVNMPEDTSSANAIHLYPVSWLQAYIDSVYTDSNPLNGLDVRIHLTSTNPTKPAKGSVYLFLGKSNAIDPVVPSSYDLVYIYEIGDKSDSIIHEQILHQLVDSVFATGTPVFCTAYASPYAQKDTYSSRDSNDKPIYPYFGAHPGNMVQFQVP